MVYLLCDVEMKKGSWQKKEIGVYLIILLGIHLIILPNQIE